MTTPSKDDVLRIAGECGAITGFKHVSDLCGDGLLFYPEDLERFAAAMYAAGADGCSTQAAVAMYLAGAEDSGAWKRWVLDHLVVCNILSAEHENNPEKAIDDLISWHVRVALDPLVSSGAQALVAKGAEDMRERAASTFDSEHLAGQTIARVIRSLPITPTNTEGEQG